MEENLMKHLRKHISFLLLFALVLGMLSGCASPEPAPAPSEPDKADISAGVQLPAQSDSDSQLQSIVSRAPGSLEKKDYTIMVYMIGSDLESQGGYASSDLLEMVNSGMYGQNNNLVVYTGGTSSWELDIRSDVNTVFALNRQGNMLEEVAYTAMPCNMGAPETLSDFLVYTYENYPAEQYGLIFWDHGGGPLYGFGSDELYGYDGLGIWELQEALNNSYFAYEPLEFIGFDACLMASLEVACALAPYARYMIASQEVEPGSGWDYSFLQTLNYSTDTLELMNSILVTYRDSMEADPWRPEYTLSCIDLFWMGDLNAMLGSVWYQMSQNLAQGGYPDLARSRNRTKAFGLGAVSDRGNSYDLVDIGHMVDSLGLTYATNSQNFWAYLQLAVLGQVTNVPHTCGLSIYYPYDNKYLYTNGGIYFDFSGILEGYQQYMNAFAQQWLSGRGNIRLGNQQKLQPETQYLTFRLEQEQLAELAQVRYTVLQYLPEQDCYQPMLIDIPAEVDEQGLVKIPKDPDVFLMYTDAALEGEEGVFWPVSLVESSSEYNRYVSNISGLLTSLDVIAGGHEPIQITLAENLQTGKVEIQSILSRSWADSAFYGRQDVSIEHFGAVAFFPENLYITQDEEGQPLPWNQWQSSTLFTTVYSNYEDGFWLEKGKLSQIEGQFYCQMVVTDTAGNVIGTRMEELCNNNQYTLLEKGGLHYHLYDDHAELMGTTQADTTQLTIPGQVNGLPVTKIGANAFKGSKLESVVIPDSVTEIDYNAFSSSYNLRQVTLSKNLKKIGNSAFAFNDLDQIILPEGLVSLGYQSFCGSELQEIIIPASLRLIGTGSFAHCNSLNTISVAPGNQNYCSKDGVLFTADGSTLVAYPEAKGSEYIIPQGVTALADEAFRGNETITHVEFNEGLTSIGMLAFYDTLGLTGLQLPESLEIIGSGAFGGFITTSMERNAIGTLHLGKNIRWIGDSAFEGYLMDGFQVDPDNTQYSSKNGCLLNASGNRMIQAPHGFTGELVVPEGVSYIDWEAFISCPGITSLVLPDSLVSINHAAYVPENLQKVTIGKNLADWQNVDQFLSVEEILLDENNYFYEMTEEGYICTQDGKQLLLLRNPQADMVIPEGVETISPDAMSYGFGQNTIIQTLTLPASLQELPAKALGNLKGLQQIQVAPGSQTLLSQDGLLYSKDGHILLACPLGRTGTITVQPGTLQIGAYAFYPGSSLMAELIILPQGLTTIQAGNFTSTGYRTNLQLHLPDSLNQTYPDLFRSVDPAHITIYCSQGSLAEELATAHGLTVVYD